MSIYRWLWIAQALEKVSGVDPLPESNDNQAGWLGRIKHVADTAVEGASGSGPTYRGISGFCSGKPIANETILGAKARYDFTITPASCAAEALVAATSTTVFPIHKKAVGGALTPIGSLTFAPGAAIGDFAFSITDIDETDYVAMRAPAVPDATLADIAAYIVE